MLRKRMLTSCVTFAESMRPMTAFVMFTVTMLKSRPVIAFYYLHWRPISAANRGRLSYEKQALHLVRKLNQARSHFLNGAGRSRIQNTGGRCQTSRGRNESVVCLQLHYCAYYDPLHIYAERLRWDVGSS